eukprot:TRINITY_DN2135_c0_g2_i1.p1 TRINITY_DN2135_c0_g2~~TRINITY_DN2135_c0_g2_i1.p1  ORF type:complete len:354 (+),score=71.06 TRINITY_DN2135_c0_g2_i1:387-1448(+)
MGLSFSWTASRPQDDQDQDSIYEQGVYNRQKREMEALQIKQNLIRANERLQLELSECRKQMSRMREHMKALTSELEQESKKRSSLEQKLRKSQDTVARLEQRFVGHTSDVVITEKDVVRKYNEFYDYVSMDCFEDLQDYVRGQFPEVWDLVSRIMLVSFCPVNQFVKSSLGGEVMMCPGSVGTSDFVVAQVDQFLRKLLVRRESQGHVDLQKKHCFDNLCCIINSHSDILQRKHGRFHQMIYVLHELLWMMNLFRGNGDEEMYFHGNFCSELDDPIRRSLCREDIEKCTERLDDKETESFGSRIGQSCFLAIPALAVGRQQQTRVCAVKVFRLNEKSVKSNSQSSGNTPQLKK